MSVGKHGTCGQSLYVGPLAGFRIRKCIGFTIILVKYLPEIGAVIRNFAIIRVPEIGIRKCGTLEIGAVIRKFAIPEIGTEIIIIIEAVLVIPEISA